jgi:hypothetical protein
MKHINKEQVGPAASYRGGGVRGKAHLSCATGGGLDVRSRVMSVGGIKQWKDKSVTGRFQGFVRTAAAVED